MNHQKHINYMPHAKQKTRTYLYIMDEEHRIEEYVAHIS